MITDGINTNQIPTSDIMKRVSAFLPMMEAANQESLVPMDTRLVKDDTDEDDDEEEEEEPTIKLKLDLGNVNDNLLFQLLAPDDEVQQQPSSIMETTTTTTTTTNIKSTAETIVSNLLQATEKEISTVRKKQKVLIEELP